jgi:GNAT superfamily N-acetyltransferase
MGGSIYRSESSRIRPVLEVFDFSYWLLHLSHILAKIKYTQILIAGGLIMAHEWRRGEYLISTDKERLDIAAIHAFLTTSYWAAGIPVEIVKRAIEHSLNFGLFQNDQQVGFARVITDYATFAYLADVFISEPFRGQGLSKWLMQVIVAHPDLQGSRKWVLFTRDAHGLYKQVGYTSLANPERAMERNFPNVYK